MYSSSRRAPRSRGSPISRTIRTSAGPKNFVGENAPRGTGINYYLKAAANDVKLSVVDAQGRTLCTSDANRAPGLHRVQWTLVAPELAGQGGGFGGGGAGGGGRGGAGGPP